MAAAADEPPGVAAARLAAANPLSFLRVPDPAAEHPDPAPPDVLERPCTSADFFRLPAEPAAAGEPEAPEALGSFAVTPSDERYMRLALEVGQEALEVQPTAEVPVGCVIVAGGAVIASDRNHVNEMKNATVAARPTLAPTPTTVVCLLCGAAPPTTTAAAAARTRG